MPNYPVGTDIWIGCQPVGHGARRSPRTYQIPKTEKSVGVLEANRLSEPDCSTLDGYRPVPICLRQLESSGERPPTELGPPELLTGGYLPTQTWASGKSHSVGVHLTYADGGSNDQSSIILLMDLSVGSKSKFLANAGGASTLF